MSEPTLTDEQREALHSLHATRINPTSDGCPICPDLRAVVAAMLADERAAREAAEAKVRDLTAGIGELADSLILPGATEPCDGAESCCGSDSHCVAMETGFKVVGPSELRALADDPDAALAEVRAEAWDEGYEAGMRDGLSWPTGETSNPYRSEAEGAGR